MGLFWKKIKSKTCLKCFLPEPEKKSKPDPKPKKDFHIQTFGKNQGKNIQKLGKNVTQEKITLGKNVAWKKCHLGKNVNWKKCHKEEMSLGKNVTRINCLRKKCPRKKCHWDKLTINGHDMIVPFFITISICNMHPNE